MCSLIGGGVILFTDFESGQGSWSAVGDWQLGDPSVTGPATTYSGNNCWGTIINNDYSANSNSVLTSPEIDLTTAANPVLTFWTWYYMETGWDGGLMQITTNGGSSWNTIPGNYISPTYDVSILDGGAYAGNPGFSGSRQSWRKITVNLGTYKGNKIKIRFAFGSDNGLQLSGWYIDNFKVES